MKVLLRLGTGNRAVLRRAKRVGVRATVHVATLSATKRFTLLAPRVRRR